MSSHQPAQSALAVPSADLGPARGTNRQRATLILAVAIAVVLWGTSSTAMRYAFTIFEPGALALLRFSVASVVLAGLAAWYRPPCPRARDLPRLILVAACGIGVYNLLFCYGLVHVRAGPGTFINNTSPLFSSILAVILLKERPSLAVWLGTLVSFIGVVLIAFAESDGHGLSPAALLLLLSGFLYACYNVLQKPLLERYGSFSLVCWAVWIGTAMLLPWSARLCRDLAHAPPAALEVMAYLGVFPTVITTLLWSWALRRSTVSALAPSIFLIPIISLALAALVLHERPPRMSLLGCAIDHAWRVHGRLAAMPIRAQRAWTACSRRTHDLRSLRRICATWTCNAIPRLCSSALASAACW